ISWSSHERIYTEKNSDWYWIVGIITISLAAICIILNNINFGILIIISSFTLSLVASKKPEILESEINSFGIKHGKTMYPFVNLDSFCVETRDAHPRLILQSKKFFMFYISILLEDTDPNTVREYLLEHLKEEEHVEPLLEKVLIYLGF
ncbi:MAG TPA: hypothetical protein VGC58_00275, partial [Candidatus Paceibacterota bacterium]